MRKTIIAVLIIALFSIAITGCTKGTNNKVLHTVKSPDAKYIAYIFIRDLGATTKASYQLSIFPIGTALINESGNIFVSYEPFNIKWKDSKNLVVTYSKKAEIFKQETKYDDLIIQYNSN